MNKSNDKAFDVGGADFYLGIALLCYAMNAWICGSIAFALFAFVFSVEFQHKWRKK